MYLYIILFTLLTGCVSMSPSDWRPESHVAVMRQCRVSCYPAGMTKYDAMDGSCQCSRRFNVKR